MPILYHYTCQYNLEGILLDGFIRPGRAVVGLTEARDYAVSLTSDANPVGHGLPDGRELSIAQAARLKVVRRDGDKLFSLDHTKFRIKVEVPNGDPKLTYVPNLLSAWPQVLAAMEIEAYFPCKAKPLTDTELLANIERLQAGLLEGKAHSWWYYRGDIPFDRFIEIGVRAGEATYLTSMPSVFREAFADPSRKKLGRSSRQE